MIKKITRKLPAVTIFKALYWISLVMVMFLAFSPQGADITQSVSDKANHTIAFFLLMFFSHQAYKKITLRQVAFLIGFGMFIEVVQHFLPYRDFSLYDMLANLSGIGVYMLIIFIIRLKKT